MNDETLVQQFNEYIRANPYATRKELIKNLKTGGERLLRLHKEGKIKYPLPLSLSASATLNRKRNKVMAGWVINNKGVSNVKNKSSAA